ncbi:MAG: M23 family metallopeptidase [Thermomicrobiales bacterium]
MKGLIAAGVVPALLMLGSTGGTPEASPVPGPVVAAYDEVGPAYEAAREDILAEGREVVDLLREGETETLYPRLSPQLQELVTANALGSVIPDLETDRVHFELPEFGVIFDGHVDGSTIEGFFYQGGPGSFRIESVEPAGTPSPGQPAQPLDGRWDGVISAGATELGISITFVTVENDLQATIHIPEQGLTDLPLTNVAYQPTAALGEVLGEYALPHAPTSGIYVAEYAWGDAALTISLNVDGQGGIAGMQVAPHWPLPPDPAAGMEAAAAFRLPFDGVWWVVWGGETVIENYHAAHPAQRHAADLVIWQDGATYQGDGTENTDYWAWGQPVLAPADGAVITVRDGIADNTPGQLSPEPHPAGNHVVIQTAGDAYVFIAHLQQGSIRVAEGDAVAAGDLIGLTGNSGNSSEPHIHIHAQNRADYYAADAIGLPLRFSGYLANGEPVTEGVPVQGQFVGNG